MYIYLRLRVQFFLQVSTLILSIIIDLPEIKTILFYDHCLSCRRYELEISFPHIFPDLPDGNYWLVSHFMTALLNFKARYRMLTFQTFTVIGETFFDNLFRQS